MIESLRAHRAGVHPQAAADFARNSFHPFQPADARGFARIGDLLQFRADTGGDFVSADTSILSNSPPLGCTTTPRIPPSRTSRFEPRPMTKSGRFSRRQNRISSANASSVARLDPELRRPANAQRGVFRQRLVKPHVAFFADNLLQLFGDDQIGREKRELFVNISGAETEDEIARMRACCRRRNARDRAAADRSRRDGRARDLVGNRLAADAGEGRLARRVNIGHDDVIGVVERRAPNSLRNALVRE